MVCRCVNCYNYGLLTELVFISTVITCHFTALIQNLVTGSPLLVKCVPAKKSFSAQQVSMSRCMDFEDESDVIQPLNDEVL